MMFGIVIMSGMDFASTGIVGVAMDVDVDVMKLNASRAFCVRHGNSCYDIPYNSKKNKDNERSNPTMQTFREKRKKISRPGPGPSSQSRLATEKFTFSMHASKNRGKFFYLFNNNIFVTSGKQNQTSGHSGRLAFAFL